MNFATLGDSKYYETILINVQNIRRIYPYAHSFVGDIGLTEDQKQEIMNYAVIVNLRKAQNAAEAMMFKTLLLFQLVQYAPICFIDGDAVLVRRLDLEPETDVVVTVRDRTDNARINNGVFILNKRVSGFLSGWLYELHKLTAARPYDRWNEQDAFNINTYSGHYTYTEVPMREYNHVPLKPDIPEKQVKNETIPEGVKIVHLKNKRMNNPGLLELVRSVV